MKLINCPICDSQNFEIVYKREYRVCIENDVYNWLGQQVICKNCGMIFTNPQPTAKMLRRFYEGYMIFGKVSEQFRESQIEFISRNIPGDCKTIFDIGASNGAFLNAARERGYKVFGVEPSGAAVQEALDKYGIGLIKDFFNDDLLDSFDNKFDIVSLSHVLEHVGEPIAFLNRAIKITHSGGYIFVEVPDTRKPQAYNIADFFTPEHTMYFTEGAMANISNRLNLRIIAMEGFEEKAAIRVLFKNDKHGAKDCALKSEYKRNLKVIGEYKSHRNRFILNLRAKLDGVVNKIIIYGAGGHTSELLQLGLLNAITIDRIIDSNPKKWGSLFEGYTVANPKILKDVNLPVLISSFDSQEEISDYLTSEFPHIRSLKLYEKAPHYECSNFAD